MGQDEGEGSRGNAIDREPPGQGCRADPAQLRDGFSGKALDGGIVEARGKGQAFVAPEREDVGILAIQIAGILAVDFQLLDDIAAKLPISGQISARAGRSTSGKLRRSIAVRRTPSSLTEMPCFWASFGVMFRLRIVVRALLETSHFSLNAALLSGPMQPARSPMGVSRWSALSARRVSLYSAREVNIR